MHLNGHRAELRTQAPVFFIGLVLVLAWFCPVDAQTGTAPPKDTSTGASDKRLVGVWEVISQKKPDGAREYPHVTLILQFTDKGDMVLERGRPQDPGGTKLLWGRYSVDKDEITIVDVRGISVTWAFQLNEDGLIIRMPGVDRQFHLRRVSGTPRP